VGVDLWMMVEISHNDEPWRPLMHEPHLYKAHREEAMFALLGDVTNNKGRFKDVFQPARPTPDGKEMVPAFWYRPDQGDHDPIEPICEPRGVPDDASPAWKERVAEWAAKRDRVVTTWLTPEEIIEANWDQQVYRQALLMEADYIELVEKGIQPRRWMSNVGGKGVRVVSEIEYAEGLRGERETIIRAGWNAGTLRSLSHEMPDMFADLLMIRPESTKMRLMFIFEA